MWRFLEFNVLQNLSIFYGHHAWHWYLTQGLPVLAGTLLVPAGVGVWHAGPALRRLAYVAGATVAADSLLAHKEFRFVQPVLPILAVLGGHGLAAVATPQRPPTLAWTALAATQLPLAAYFSMVHQRGVVDVTHWLRHLPRHEPWSAAVLMPCHSTPWQAYIHQPNATLAFLTCEPPSHARDLAAYRDEADVFFDDPVKAWDSQWGPAAGSANAWDYVVLFDALTPTLGPRLHEAGLRECARFFNSHFIDDARREGDVLVYCRTL